MKLVVVLVSLLGACSEKPAQQAEVNCTSAAAALIEADVGSVAGLQLMRDKVVVAMVKTCERDGWTRDPIACISRGKRARECGLAPDQIRRLEAAIASAIGVGGGGGGGTGGGPPDPK